MRDLVDIFAFQHLEKSVQAVLLRFDAHGSEKVSDVLFGGMGVAELKQEICREMFHSAG